MDLLPSLQWRYATKIFDSSRKIPEDLLKNLLDAARLAPSSYGFEPWTFVVVESAELRNKLREVSWGQAQVTDASHLIVFCRQKDFGLKDADALIARTAELRGIDPSSLEGFHQLLTGFISGLTTEKAAEWMNRQVYLALGIFLAQCAANQVDACPMEGFDPVQFDRILDLESKGLKSVVVCAVGYHSGEDKYAQASKVRRSAEEVIKRIA